MTPFRKPPPIEDLPELSWKRVEQNLCRSLDSGLSVSQPKAPTQKRWPWLAGVGALAAAAVLALWLSGDRESGTTIATEKTSSSIKTNSEIQTKDSSTSIRIEGASLEVQPHSDVVVEQNGGEIAFRLRDGGMRLTVDPRDHLSPVTVSSGDVHIEVVGTEFAVSREASATQVVVFEGLVAVSHAGDRELVRAGESWTEKAQSGNAKRTKVSRNHKRKPAERQSARSLFEEAAAKEHASPEEALDLYRQAARESGPWAANALFAQARLLLAQGNDARAKTLLLRYQKRFPTGANTTDVTALLQGIEQE